MIELLQQPWLLLSVSGALLAGAGLLVVALMRQLRELRARDQAREAAIEALREDLRKQKAPMVRGPDERQLRLERQVDELRARQERLELQALEAHAYQQAVDWVQRGADVEQLVRKLGLSHGEAELVQALHRAGTIR
jgi:hypothetical protein